ncbi:MAG: hypothetical protein ABR572_09925 [Cryomorphaceae bacterium]|nr:hypothetical protein [Flavobacteriales bacterium]
MKTAILALSLAICGTGFAQSDANRTTTNSKPSDERREIMRERIESQKVAYITDKLELTPEEAKGFWPVYNEYQTQKERFREENEHLGVNYADDEGPEMDAEKEKEARKKDQGISEEELNNQMKTRFERRRGLIDLDQRFYEEYKAVLPTWKVAALYRAEHSFKREMMRKMRDRGEGNARGSKGGRQNWQQRQAR